MTLTLTDDKLNDPSIPSEWQQAIKQVGKGKLDIHGDRTGMRQIFVRARLDSVQISDAVEELGNMSPSVPLAVSNEAVSHLLHTGFIPAPLSPFVDVQELGIGDVVHLSMGGGKISTRSEFHFPYRTQDSSGASTPDTQKLLSLLASSVARQLEPHPNRLLMLSSGKDSSGIALGIAEAGLRNVRGVTFMADTANDEDAYVSTISQRTGIKHEFMRLPTEKTRVRKHLTDYFTRSAFPCVDYVQAAYVMCLGEVGVNSGAVIDGMGNDVYVGHLPPRQELIKYRYCIGRGGLAGLIRHFIPHYSKANFLLRSRAEAFLPGYFLRPNDTTSFYPPTFDTNRWGTESTRESRGINDLCDLRAAVRGRHYDVRSGMLKARTAAAGFGAEAVFPYCDQALIDYYFNLPEASRFNRQSGTNKVLLRQLLREKLDYDDVKLFKRGFQFDGVRFLNANREFVREEILGCQLWDRSLEKPLSDWMTQMERLQTLSVAVMTLFLVSGWYNHSPLLKITPAN